MFHVPEPWLSISTETMGTGWFLDHGSKWQSCVLLTISMDVFGQEAFFLHCCTEGGCLFTNANWKRFIFFTRQLSLSLFDIYSDLSPDTVQSTKNKNPKSTSDQKLEWRSWWLNSCPQTRFGSYPALSRRLAFIRLFICIKGANIMTIRGHHLTAASDTHCTANHKVESDILRLINATNNYIS